MNHKRSTLEDLMLYQSDMCGGLVITRCRCEVGWVGGEGGVLWTMDLASCKVPQGHVLLDAFEENLTQG